MKGGESMGYVQGDRQPHVPIHVDGVAEGISTHSNTELHIDLGNLKQPSHGSNGESTGPSVDSANGDGSRDKHGLSKSAEQFPGGLTVLTLSSPTHISDRDLSPPLLRVGPSIASQPFSCLQPGLHMPLRDVNYGSRYESDEFPEEISMRHFSSSIHFFPSPSMLLSEEQSHQSPTIRCPRDRKRFFRKFMRALKQSDPHRSRQQKEAKEYELDNPSGVAMETLWKELQGYLHNRKLREQEQYLHNNQEKIARVLSQVCLVGYTCLSNKLTPAGSMHKSQPVAQTKAV